MLSPKQILYLGFIATGVNAISQIPQVLITFRTTNLEGVSISTNVLLFVAQCLWFVYGIYVDSIPLIVSAGMTGLLCFIIIIRTLYIRQKSKIMTEDFLFELSDLQSVI